jgi:uncharacterized protein YfiM (DUF2279 family)
VGPRSKRVDRHPKEGEEEKECEPRRYETDQKEGSFASASQVNQLFALSLAANLVFAQTAVVRDSWFGIDKIKHFFMSAFIESVSYSVLQAAHVKRRPALSTAIGVTAAFGVAREIHDKRTPGKWFSYQDLTWDALGIGAGAAMLTHTVK